MKKKLLLSFILFLSCTVLKASYKINFNRPKDYPEKISRLRKKFYRGFEKEQIKVQVSYDKQRFTLILRTSDIYLLGIIWPDGTTYYLKDHGLENISNDPKNKIDVLPFGGSYDDLKPFKEKKIKKTFPLSFKDF